jgi:hypothetical protein
MIIEESESTTTLVFRPDKGLLVWYVFAMVFILGLMTWLVLELALEGWDLTKLQWESESGEQYGPFGNAVVSLITFGIGASIAVPVLQAILTHGERRIVIDNDPIGNVTLTQRRTAIRNSVQVLPRKHVNGIEVIQGDEETPAKLYIIGRSARLEVHSGDEEELRYVGRILIPHFPYD